MPVTVTPQQFVVVDFDADLIAAIATELAERLGLEDQAITVIVNEATLLNRVTVSLDKGIEVAAESGAFEDPKRPRRQSPRQTQIALGHALLLARDRLWGGFADAPGEPDLTLAQRAAWQAYQAGRLSRLGVGVNQQRSRYDFRNRHGFTDLADAAFEQLWAADDLDWSAVMAVSGALLASRAPS